MDESDDGGEVHYSVQGTSSTFQVQARAPGGQYDGKVKVIFRNQVQPWHASSTFVHEAGLAVRPSLALLVYIGADGSLRSRASRRRSSGRSRSRCVRPFTAAPHCPDIPRTTAVQAPGGIL